MGMEMRSVAKLVVAMAALAMVMATTTTAAQQQFSRQEKAAFVNLHNKARAAVGVGTVAWSDKLAAKALEHARYCRKQHIQGPYGENLWWSGVGGSGTPGEAMSYWVGERPYYDYRRNKCAVGHQCGHYTQVVWRRTSYVGCARVTCNRNDIGTIIACNYSPPGNIDNQRPY
uniref:SCP domain-containing protein n=1 Tax=Oryza punctata TaxID=4537 RepID=A0A0E0LGP1_ORYPU